MSAQRHPEHLVRWRHQHGGAILWSRANHEYYGIMAQTPEEAGCGRSAARTGLWGEGKLGKKAFEPILWPRSAAFPGTLCSFPVFE
jgi:hypothetical protein